MIKWHMRGFTDREEVNKMHKQTKEKTTTKIRKFLYNILKASKIIYEICKVAKSVLDLFHE